MRNVSRSKFLALSAASSALTYPLAVAAQDSAVLRVGCSRVETQAQAFYADELGLFKKAGLQVDVQSMRGGAASVTALVAGALEITCTNGLSFGQAVQRGVPLEILVPGALWDTGFPAGAAIVAANAPYKRGKDLEGQTVGVISLGGQSQLAMTAFIIKDGGNIGSVKFVEIPSSATTEAVVQGRIASAFLDEPELSANLGRVRTIGFAQDAIANKFALTVWIAKPDWVKANISAARRFVAAMIDAGKWSMANPEAAAKILEKRLSFKESKAQIRFAVNADPTLVQVVWDAAARFNMLPPMRATEFVWNGR